MRFGLTSNIFSTLANATVLVSYSNMKKFLCLSTNTYSNSWGWSGGAMVLGKLPVPGRPTIWITVGQGLIALAVGAGGGGLDIFTLIYPLLLSPSLWETARYRLKYCLKGPLNPKQPTNSNSSQCIVRMFVSTFTPSPITDYSDTWNAYNGCVKSCFCLPSTNTFSLKAPHKKCSRRNF